MKTVNEVAKLAGVSVRTLHHYDQVGLLRPGGETPSGYRLYGRAELERLQNILFLRELDFPLKEIKAILESSSFETRKALERHRDLLILKRDRLQRLIDLAGNILKGEQEMGFNEFDASDIEAARNRYREEAVERWGGTAAFAESEGKTKNYTKEDWLRITAEASKIFDRFAALAGKEPDDPQVQALVHEWRMHITKNYYNCTPEILSGLGDMYVADERFSQNIDGHGRGTAQFMSRAIKAYTK